MAKQRALAALVKAHLRAKERGRAEYKRAEQLLDELLQRVKPGRIVKAGGRKYRLKDLFLETNKVYRAHGIGRYEIEAVEE